VPCEGRPQRLVVSGLRNGLGEHDDVHTAKLTLVQPEALAHLSLDPVAIDRESHSTTAQGDTEASMGQTVGPVQHREAAVDGPLGVREDPRILFAPGESPLLSKCLASSPGPGLTIRR
jgi:hypothetical protein